VIKYSRLPRSDAMAVIALVAGRNVGQRFPCGLNTVMTTNAIAGKGRVIHKGNSRPARGDVAV